MSEPYPSNLNEITDDELDDELVVYPIHDLLLSNIKPALVKRENKRLKKKQKGTLICVNKINPYIQTLCKKLNILFNCSLNYRVPDITIFIAKIKKVIGDYNGPTGKDFTLSDVDRKHFNKIATNWCDNSSKLKKIECDFFVMYIEEIKLYIRICCQPIVGISELQRECISHCIWCYIRYELLNATITFERTAGKPLIRNKTLKVDVHVKLHTSLDVIQFVEEFKLTEKELKENKNKNGNGSKQKRIEFCKIFAKKLVKDCKELLNEAEAHDQLNATFVTNNNNNNNNNNIVGFNEFKDNYNVLPIEFEDNYNVLPPIEFEDNYNVLPPIEFKDNYNVLPPIEFKDNYNVLPIEFEDYNNYEYEYKYNPFQYNNHQNEYNNNTINDQPIYYGYQRGGYCSSVNRWNPNQHVNTYYNRPNYDNPNIIDHGITTINSHLPNTMVTNGTVYDDNIQTFDDEYTNY